MGVPAVSEEIILCGVESSQFGADGGPGALITRLFLKIRVATEIGKVAEDLERFLRMVRWI